MEGLQSISDAIRSFTWPAVSGGVATYQARLVEDLLDRQWTEAERVGLHQAILDEGLHPEVVAVLHRGLFNHVVNAVLADGISTQDEADALMELREFLDVSWECVPAERRDALRATYLPRPQAPVAPVAKEWEPRVTATTIALDAGEDAYAEFPVELLRKKVVRRNWQGGSSGFSFRIMRGVSFRVGGTRGTSVPEEEIVAIDSGQLVLTNQRLVFVGTEQVRSTSWDRVIRARVYDDAIEVSAEGRYGNQLFRFAGVTPGSTYISRVVDHMMGA